jgi:alanine-alpha-ketoisovalerate/valine-pyruvate aminotransferase
VAYVKTPRGLRTLNSVWAQHLSEEVRRRFYKNWCKSKKKAFTKYAQKYDTDAGKKEIQMQLEKMKKYASVVRVIAHTQVGIIFMWLLIQACTVAHLLIYKYHLFDNSCLFSFNIPPIFSLDEI